MAPTWTVPGLLLSINLESHHFQLKSVIADVSESYMETCWCVLIEIILNVYSRVELSANGLSPGRCIFPDKDSSQHAECSQEPRRSCEGTGFGHEDHGSGKNSEGIIYFDHSVCFYLILLFFYRTTSY